jgi:peptidoglycan/LPS O-acetylase OafA/YrhL
VASSEFARSRKPEPALITEAEWSRSKQHAARKRRYVITMGVRAVALVLAAVVYSTTHLLWLVLILALLGTVLPWIAVVMANDAPPKKRLERHVPAPRPDRQLESRPPRIIEH